MSHLYQEKFKRHVNMAQPEDSDDSGEEQEGIKHVKLDKLSIG